MLPNSQLFLIFTMAISGKFMKHSARGESLFFISYIVILYFLSCYSCFFLFRYLCFLPLRYPAPLYAIPASLFYAIPAQAGISLQYSKNSPQYRKKIPAFAGIATREEFSINERVMNFHSCSCFDFNNPAITSRERLSSCIATSISSRCFSRALMRALNLVKAVNSCGICPSFKS